MGQTSEIEADGNFSDYLTKFLRLSPLYIRLFRIFFVSLHIKRRNLAPLETWDERGNGFRAILRQMLAKTR